MSSKFADMPGYDTASPTVFGDSNEEKMAALPESDQDWRRDQADDEKVEIISCDAKEAIRKFQSGELASVSELKGEQITEAVETARTLVNKMTSAKPVDNTAALVDTVGQARAEGASMRVYSNSVEKVKVLEERVARLESMVAVQPEALHGGGTLADVANSVLSRMALLDPEQLVQADARLASLVERFNTVPESLQKLPDLTKWESLFCSIPQIVNRLESLGELHALAGRVGSSLVALEKSHQQIIAQLDRTEATQNELHGAMSTNIQVASENAKKLNERVEKLN